MNTQYKGKAIKIFFLTCLSALCIITLYGSQLHNKPKKFHFQLTIDTIPKKNKTQTDGTNKILKIKIDTGEIIKSDTLPVLTTDSFSIKTSKEALDAPISYHADDSMVMDVPGKKITLYGKKSKLNYSDNELTAPEIFYDQSTNLVKAYLKKDSAGKVISYPSFNQGDFKSVSDTISFNMKTGRGITKGTYTQQGEMYVYGATIKKVNSDIFYALHGRFTTCNLDTPHFAFVSKKIKFINQKWAFTGPVHPEIEGVPLPIVLPFGIYPLTQGRHSGFLPPTYTVNEQLGIALEGIGYYKVLSPTWDIVTRGTIYSYGGWTASVNPRYYKRYRFQGNLGFDMQNFRTGFKGDPDYSSTRTINIQWSHNMDNKARPGVNFRANVNAGSSKFNSNVPNSPVLNFQNQKQSSITYSKVWKDKPYNISVSANHNQNTQLRLINLNLPDVSFNVNTLYPFRRHEPIGNYNWYENIGVALNSNARSLSFFNDEDSLRNGRSIGEQIGDNFKWGASHNIPITLSLPPLGPVQVSPGVSYQEKWYQEKFIRRWNETSKKVDTTVIKGFYTAREMAFSLGTSTRIFGMYAFNKKSKIQAIRHEIRPTVSANYKPDFNKQNYYTIKTDTLNNFNRFSIYDGSIYGSFGEGKFGGMSFGIDNVLQMKVRNKKDTAEASQKKVSILDGLSINSSYNFLSDSFKLTPLNVNARSNLFDKVNITGNATFDPYQKDSSGKSIDKLVWAKKPLSLGTLLSGGLSLSTKFRGGDKTKTADQNVNRNIKNNNNGVSLDEYQQEAAYIQNNPTEYADFSIPWSVDFSYSLRFFRQLIGPNLFKTSFNQDINWNTSANLTPKWKIGVNGSYNITVKQLGQLSMYLSRELHCWQMAINISPVGRYRFFSINISPKSAILRDLKINRTRSFYDL